MENTSRNTIRFDISFLLLVSGLFYLLWLGSGSLASWDEAFYAIASKEMLETRDILTLYQGGMPLFNKPPLYMWFSALAIKIFGVSEFAIRLGSALSGVGCVVATYILGLKLFNRKAAFISALLLMSSSHFIIFLRRGMLDVPLTLFVTLSFYFFWLGREKALFYIFSGIMCGLAMMTKGAAGLVVPLGIGLYSLVSWNWAFLKKKQFYIGLGLLALVALPWHIYEYIKYGNRFLDGYFLYHVVRRSSQAIEGHAGSMYYYLRVLINKFRPWVFILPFSIIYSAWKARKSKEHLFILSWICAVFFVFTFARTKLQWYIIPMYPALIITAGVLFDRIISRKMLYIFVTIILIIMFLHIPYSHIFVTDHSKGIKEISQLVPADSDVYLYDTGEWPAVWYYFDEPVKTVSDKNIKELISSDNNFVIIIETKNIEKLKDAGDSNLETIVQVKEITLLGRRKE